MPWPQIYPATGSHQFYTQITTNTSTPIYYAASNVPTFNAHIYYPSPAPQWNRPVQDPLTPEEQRLANERRQGAAREIALAREENAQRPAAEQAAEDLLREVLGEERYQQWQLGRQLLVPSGQHPGRRYRIRPRQMIDVQEERPVRPVLGMEPDTRQEWQTLHRLCIHPRQTHPVGDEMATLYLMAAYDEAELLRIANRHAA